VPLKLTCRRSIFRALYGAISHISSVVRSGKSSLAASILAGEPGLAVTLRLDIEKALDGLYVFAAGFDEDF
jgi:hypothetical protein